MKQQNIVDVIVYLLDTVVSQQKKFLFEATFVEQRLEEAGFDKATVDHAFDWLRELIEQQSWYAASSRANTNKTLRIFSCEEGCKISLATRGFILSLEYAGILDTNTREIVISQLMQLKQRSVDLTDAKWVVFFVLMSKTNKNSQEMRSYLLTMMAPEV